jgi:hypothetical protein
MIDPDLKKQLDDINVNLTEIKKKTGTSVWKSFFTGMFSALGYVAGLAIVVVIFGWILQKTGLLPAFENQVKNFTDLVNGAKQLLPSNSNNDNNQGQKNSNTSGNKDNTTITLPNGQQYKVNINQ